MKTQSSTYLGLLIISIATLALEILQTRIISILLWPLTVYFVISLALLGFGASGALISIFHSFFKERFKKVISLSSLGFSLSILILLATIPLLNRMKSNEFFSYLFLLSFILALSFFFSGLAIGSILTYESKNINKLYFINLFGSGIGSIIILKSLSLWSGENNLILISLFGVVSAIIFNLYGFKKKTTILVMASYIILLLFAVIGGRYIKIIPLVSKELKLMNLSHPERKLEYRKWDPIARVDVAYLENDYISLPENIKYKMVFQDGDAPSIILGFRSDFKDVNFAKHTLMGVPYWIKERPEVLIIGIGGGPDIATALHFNSKKVTGVEINKRMIEIVKNRFKYFAGNPYERENVYIHHAEGRHFAKSSKEKFDIIQLTGVDTYIASFGATQNLAESYLYTKNAFKDYLEHLKANGILSITYPNWGAGLRLFVTGLETLKELGIKNPEKNIMVSLSCGFVNIMIKTSPFASSEIETLKVNFKTPMYGIYFPLFHKLWGGEYPTSFFTESRILYSPDSNFKNEYNDYYMAWKNGEDRKFIKTYNRNIAVATDDKPFFFVQDKWPSNIPVFKSFLKILEVLIAFTLVFILLPLLIFKKEGLKTKGSLNLFLYFLCLGLGYMFIEIAFLQKSILFLGHPTYSIAITLLALLVFSGMGSLISEKFKADKSLIIASMIPLTIIVLVYILFLGDIFQHFLNRSLPVRAFITIIVLAPLGFVMGIPFPTGIKIIENKLQNFIPWGWGINSCASVIGIILAQFLAMNFGFSSVFCLSIAAYLIAMISMLSFIKIEKRLS